METILEKAKKPLGGSKAKQPDPAPPEVDENAPVPAEAAPPAVGEPAAPQPAAQMPNVLFVAYQIGNGRIEHQFIECPFEDVETLSQAQTVISAISQALGNRRITPIFWKMLINQ